MNYMDFFLGVLVLHPWSIGVTQIRHAHNQKGKPIIDHRDVIDHYDREIKMNPGLHVFFHSTSCCGPRRMNLSVEDRDALEAFLDTFTDDDFLADPKFSDPFAP